MNSKEVNKIIRNKLSDFFKLSDFEKISERRYLRKNKDYFYCIEIKSVGKYFSEVTGWPPQSLCSRGGLFCRFIKPREGELKNDVPINGIYHFAITNLCNLNQEKYKINLLNSAEKNRNDLWWVDDSTDVNEIIDDLKNSINKYSFDFFGKFNIMQDIISEIEKMSESYNKYWNAYYTYKALNEEKIAEDFKARLFNEAKRIGTKIVDLNFDYVK